MAHPLCQTQCVAGAMVPVSLLVKLLPAVMSCKAASVICKQGHAQCLATLDLPLLTWVLAE